MTPVIESPGYQPFVVEYPSGGWTHERLLAGLTARQALGEPKSPAREPGLLEDGSVMNDAEGKRG